MTAASRKSKLLGSGSEFWPRFLVLAALVVVTFLLGRVPAAQTLDDLLRAPMQRLRRAGDESRGPVVACIDEAALEQDGPWPWSSEKLCGLLLRLLEARPSGVIVAPDVTRQLVAASPSGLAPLREAASRVPLLLSLRVPLERPELLGPRGLALDRLGFRWGVWSHQPDADGVLRRLELRPALGIEAPETGLARILGPGPAMDEPSPRIDFTGGARSLPYVSWTRLASGELPASLVRDRPVVVGLSAGSVARLFSTPTTDPHSPMPEAETAAHALGTLLSARPLLEVAPSTQALLHAGAAALFLALLHWSAIASAYKLLVAALATNFIVAAALYSGWSLIVALTPLLMVDLGLFMMTMRFRLVDYDRQIRSLVLDLARSPEHKGASAKLSWREALVVLGQFTTAEVTALISIPTGKGRPVVEASVGFGPEELEELIVLIKSTLGRSLPAVEPFEAPLGDSTLSVVPLVAGGRPLGAWVLATPRGEPTPLRGSTAPILLHAAGELAHRQLGKELLGEGGRASGGSVFRDPREQELSDITALSQGALSDRDFLLDVLQKLDVGILTAHLTGEIGFVNAAFARGVGLSREDVIRTGFFDTLARVFATEDQSLRDCLTQVLLSGRVLEKEFQPAGTRSTYFITWSTLGRQQERSGHFCMAVDISRHRALDALKTQMLELVSHRVRNLMAVIQGYSEEFDELPGLSSEARETGSTIKGASRQLSAVFEDFQNVSRFALVSDRLHSVPVDVAHAAQNAIEANATFADQRGCIVKLDPPGLIPAARGDPVFVARSLEALLYQSVLTCSSGATVSVSIEQQADRLVVEIRDRGHGMPQETADRFFDEPAQGAEKTEIWQSAGQLRPHEVRRAIIEMEGGIEAASAIGEGTTFRLWLPRL